MRRFLLPQITPISVTQTLDLRTTRGRVSHYLGDHPRVFVLSTAGKGVRETLGGTQSHPSSTKDSHSAYEPWWAAARGKQKHRR